MTLVIDAGEEPVHTPKRRDVFEFDEEVSSIFENMAVRSIPMYAETHRVHSQLVRAYVDNQHDLYGPRHVVTIADVGASTGVFIKSLVHAYGYADFRRGIEGVEVVAIDPSGPMIDKLTTQLPWVTAVEDGASMLQSVPGYFDVVNASYMLQFVRPEYQLETLQSIAHSLKKGGMLLLSQKEEQITPRLTTLFSQQYIQFRKDNGYSEEEIVSKTEALRNSMWPIDYATLTSYLKESGFVGVQETTRWLNFNSLVCFKG